MRKSLQPTDGDIAERNEHARKIFRYISEVARRLDEASGACKSISDLFKTPVEVNRQKLRENCEKLMFADPVLYGYKAQEILWRKGYYEVVTSAKQFNANNDQNANLLLAHIEAGIGHYQQIIYKMQMETSTDMRNLIDYPILDIADLKQGDSVNDDVTRSRKTIHNCLIYIGDLCRYKAELENDWDPTHAARYYLQAACIDRDIGSPYNQLGTLYIGKNYNLDSVCFYLHSLTCTVPFEGVEDNLIGLLDKNNKTLENLSGDYSNGFAADDNVKLFICRFLSLLDHWYFQKDQHLLGELSNATLYALKEGLALKPDYASLENAEGYLSLNKSNVQNEIKPQYINSKMILNVASICLLYLSRVSDADHSTLFPIKAFTLAFYSQLVEKLLRDLEEMGLVPVISRNNGYIKHKNGSLPSKKSINKDSNHKLPIEKPTDEQDSNIVNKGDVAELNDDRTEKDNSQKKLSKLRLRRRKHRKSDSVIDSGEESCSDLSELELNESEDDISLAGESSSEDYGSDNDDCTKENKEQIDSNIPPNNIESLKSKELSAEENCRVKNDEVNGQKLTQFMEDNILPSMMLLQDWLVTETDLIKSCGKSGHALFKSLVDVLNILNVHLLGRPSTSVQRQTHQSLNDFQSAAEEMQEYYKVLPLPEDLKLKNVHMLKQHQDNLNWDIFEYIKPTAMEETAMRTLKIVDFGHFITSLIPGVCYNRSQQYFFVKYKFLDKKSAQKFGAKKAHEKKEFRRQSQKIQPKTALHSLAIHNRIHHSSVHGKNNSDTSQMRILGKLWLMNQVKELETQVRSGKKSHNFPPYVVIDTDALCLHMKVVKQLVSARKFIVLIPTVVLQAIDELKKESSSVRDAIRWLEAQLRSGSRFLRAQRSQEVAPLTWVKYPKKMNREMQNFIQIVEFCNHFITKDSTAAKSVSCWSGDGDSETTLKTNSGSPKAEDKIKNENGDSRPANIIVLLTGSKQYSNALEQSKDFSYTGLAQTAGVTMEYIQDFSLKWRHIFSKNGKKR